MFRIYSMIWTICHKVMWFYRNTVLFHIIFVVTHGEIFGHLAHMGPLTVKTKWRCRRFIGRDCVIFLLLLKEIRLQLSHKASQQVLLQYVLHTAETDKVSLVLWSTVSQNVRPLGAARIMWVYFALWQQSTLNSQNSGCVLYWRFRPNWWSEKIQAGIPQSLGASYVRGASYIRDKMVVEHTMMPRGLVCRSILDDKMGCLAYQLIYFTVKMSDWQNRLLQGQNDIMIVLLIK